MFIWSFILGLIFQLEECLNVRGTEGLERATVKSDTAIQSTAFLNPDIYVSPAQTYDGSKFIAPEVVSKIV